MSLSSLLRAVTQPVRPPRPLILSLGVSLVVALVMTGFGPHADPAFSGAASHPWETGLIEPYSTLAGLEHLAAPAPMKMADPVGAPTGQLDYCLRMDGDCLSQEAQGPAQTGAILPLSAKISAQVLKDQRQKDEITPPSAAPEDEVSPNPALNDLAHIGQHQARALRPGRVWPTRLKATDQVMTLLNQVNQQTNHLMAMGEDQALYGQADVWKSFSAQEILAGQAIGDCEDFALSKRRWLMALGLPAQALSLAVAETPWGESHLVLLVSTDHGEMVLDNLTDQILSWQDTKLRFRFRQDPSNVLIWRRIQA